MWFMTAQSAPVPHVPGQGSAHLKRMQARPGAQSGLVSHSRRHPLYGSPWKPARHVHAPTPLRSIQSALEPHGDGKQGSMITGVRSVAVDRDRLLVTTYLLLAQVTCRLTVRDRLVDKPFIVVVLENEDHN